MTQFPSRRDVLTAGGAALAGFAGGYAARPYLDNDSVPEPVPFAWAATEWPYPDYDPARTRNPPSESAPAGTLREQWRYGLRGHEQPAVVAANGRIVLGTVGPSDGSVVSVDADTGDERWSKLAGDTNGAPVAAAGDQLWRTDYDAGASVSLPTIVDGTAYASVGTDRWQRLVAFDLADGTETAAWPLPTYGGAPVVADGWVYVPTYDAAVALQ